MDTKSKRDRFIRREAQRLWNLPSMGRQPGWEPGLPNITIRWSATKAYSSGHCYYANIVGKPRIVITLGSNPAEHLSVLLHELVHAAMPRGVHHDASFWQAFRSAAREAWPTAPFPFHERATTKWDRHNQITVGLMRMGVQS